VRRIAQYLPLCFLALGSVQFAAAQSSFDLNIGFGSFHNSASGQGIDNINSPNAFGSCMLNAGDPNCEATPSLSGFFLGFGGDLMLKKHYGFGAEWDLTPAKQNYGPLQYRQHFIDFDGIYAPINQKKVAVKLYGGIGDAKTGFSITESGCVGTAVCTSQTSPVGSSNHFQIHAGAGVEVFVTDHIYIRPQFDFHYVPNFTNQWGSDVAVGGMVWVGYSWGDR
jgi:hypothetical protein